VTSRVVYSQNFVAGQDTTDAYGHGTHVAGIVGSNGDDSTGPLFSRTFKGVAPNANIISLKVLDQNGGGQEADTIAAIQTAIALKSTYNIRVINLSLGRPVFESYTLDPLCQAVEAAWKAGIVVVAAAGNYGRDDSRATRGYGTIASPGNDPYVITVGATNSKGTPSPYDDSIASYSAKGPTAVDHIAKPDIVAPGNGVVSLLAGTNCTLYTESNKTHVSMVYETLGLLTGVSTSYLKLSGTSMATPVVAGAAALLIQKNPSLTPDQVKARLMKSAKKILPQYMFGTDSITLASFSMKSDIFTVGAGYLDINAALANTDLATLPALSPVAKYDPITHKVTVALDYSISWGNPIAFDDSVVWGDSLFSGKLPNGSSLLWGQDDSVVWGDSTSLGFAVVWGDSVNYSIPLQATGNDDDDQ
jgi:serine protease AprX